MASKRRTLMCDFETTTDVHDARVWAGCAVDIDSMEIAYLGTDIDSFMEWLATQNTVCYFHNLKFDGEFILYWLLKKGYRYSPEKTDKTFTCLIADTGAFYSLEVVFRQLNGRKYNKVVFYDSLKKLPFKVAVVAKAFEVGQSKGEIDYNAPRPVGYQLTDEEKDYITTDCEIVAKALKIQQEQGLTRMTIASDALGGYKQIIGKDTFAKWFPVLPYELDKDIRRAYKGGYVYLKPEHRGRRGLAGVTLDVNSLYPWAMYNCLLPYGYPVYYEGKPQHDDRYPLYIVHLRCCFELKPDHLPTLQLKNTRRFVETEYLTTSRVKYGKDEENDPVEMWLTSVDFQLLQDHYDLSDVEFINGFRFKGAVGMFKDYIDHWMHVKETTTGALRQIAKLMLNSLYGKFATNPRTRRKEPYLCRETDTVRDGYSDYEYRDPVYTAMGAFITAYAREKTLRSGQAVYDRFIYADTDSLHLIGTDEPEGLDIHPTRLGAWKNEGTFTDSKYIRAKTYMETVDGVAKVTCAGMPDNVKAQVTYDNFCTGSVFDGKLMPKRCPGGVVLVPRTFTIM